MFSAPAARTTGVARRNANRAGPSRVSPLILPATLVTPSRLIPATSARDRRGPDAYRLRIAHRRQPPVGLDRSGLLALAQGLAAGRNPARGASRGPGRLTQLGRIPVCGAGHV